MQCTIKLRIYYIILFPDYFILKKTDCLKQQRTGVNVDLDYECCCVVNNHMAEDKSIRTAY